MNENMKKVIENEFSLNENKEIIDEKLEKQFKTRSYKRIVLTCLILIMIVSGFYLINQDEEVDDIYINHATQSTAKLDIAFANTETIDLKQLTIPNIDVNNFAIPKDLTSFNGYKVYDSKEHKQLLEYRLNYYQPDDVSIRNIEINFSDKRQPARDLCVSGKGKSTFVNGVEMKVYGDGGWFYALFQYQGYQFDVQASQLSQNEFIELVKSIIV
ncbi:MAG: DUF4367 domain-containing protein [Coprobacillus sp.]